MTDSTSKDRLYRDPALAQFYDLNNGWGDAKTFCAGLAQDAKSVLDLGCGTGMLIATLAPECEAVGADPAAAMLEIARTRPGGDQATWIEADAGALRLDQRFDLIVMTGNAFQTLLSEDAQRAALATIAYHLTPQGRFIFDTRSPEDEDWRTWTPEASLRHLAHPRLGRIDAWNDVAQDAATGIVTYQTHYRVAQSGQMFSAASQIAFTPRDKLCAMLADAGLRVDQWYGDWQGSPGTEASLSFIPLGGLA